MSFLLFAIVADEIIPEFQPMVAVEVIIVREVQFVNGRLDTCVSPSLENKIFEIYCR